MCFTTKQFSILSFFVPKNKLHGSRGLGKHYHMFFFPKLGHGTCSRSNITYACNQFTSTLEKSWTSIVPQHQQPRYQPVKKLTWWPMLVFF